MPCNSKFSRSATPEHFAGRSAVSLKEFGEPDPDKLLAAAIIVPIADRNSNHLSKEDSVGYSLQDFSRDTREILKADASRAQVEKVKTQMERLLVDPDFVKQYFGEGQPLGLKRIHIDPTGFEVMTYRYNEARKSNPHDHGDSWAIYGQVSEYTEMTLWERTDDGSDPDHAKLKAGTPYRLNPGKAGVYYGRQLHSTATPVNTRYLRVTGTDLENIERLRIDAATGKIQRIYGRQTGAPAAIAR
jgi:hypothetical protein